jgi:hypothetical protein
MFADSDLDYSRALLAARRTGALCASSLRAFAPTSGGLGVFGFSVG